MLQSLTAWQPGSFLLVCVGGTGPRKLAASTRRGGTCRRTAASNAWSATATWRGRGSTRRPTGSTGGRANRSHPSAAQAAMARSSTTSRRASTEGRPADAAADYDHCVACHNPHEQMKTADAGKFDPARPPQAQCGNCHEPRSRLPEPSRDDDTCLTCHSRYDLNTPAGAQRRAHPLPGLPRPRGRQPAGRRPRPRAHGRAGAGRAQTPPGRGLPDLPPA